ncbi:MAG TPA: hypothetical protein VGR66_07320 [Candidatus Eisenbacteria bacterium]|jgi:hypothetical protein|nr:hypothetical protein [Candidatus Eisenbacteria bacterium]
MSETFTRESLRHTVATLAYRCGKAVRDAPPQIASFKAGPTTRTPVEVLQHIGDLLDWALLMARGGSGWKESPERPWDEEVERFFASLRAFDDYLASDAPLATSGELLFQGPIADALQHTGQINMLRRLAGSAVRGENYRRADIAIGRVGREQKPPDPSAEFD